MAKSKPERPLPNRIREVRKARGMVLGDLAEKSGLTVPTISALERGVYALKQHQAETLATALGVKAADLLPLESGGLTPEERELVETYREIPAALRSSYDALREKHQPFRGAGEIVPIDRPRKRG